MEFTKEQIGEAIDLLSKVCSVQNTCESCPFGQSFTNSCYLLLHQPVYWSSTDLE